MHRQRDILLIPLPFTDLTTAKKRPVLVLSNQCYNSTSDDLIVAAITSNLDEKPYAVKFGNSDMEEGNLLMESCIRVDKLYTLSQNIVVKRFGKVSETIFQSVRENLIALFDEST